VKSLVLKFAFFLVAAVAVVFTASCAYLYLEQDNIIFRGVATNPQLADRWRAQRVEIAAGEVPIEGWWIDNPNSKTNAVALYFGGNMEDVLQTATTTAVNVDARRVLVTNYRGYGGTSGKPSEAALFSDALAVYDYAIAQPDVASSAVVLVGRSLGSGVAIHVAASRPVRGVVLITPYDSIVGVAQEMYPLLPMRWLVKHPFASDVLASKMTVPALILAGEQDIVIPAKHAQRLYDAWAGPKHIHVLAGVGHNSIGSHPDYYPLTNKFLASVAQ
jgi:pimeloyl-ACP methyl ester carboxylesterase